MSRTKMQAPAFHWQTPTQDSPRDERVQVLALRFPVTVVTEWNGRARYAVSLSPRITADVVGEMFDPETQRPTNWHVTVHEGGEVLAYTGTDDLSAAIEDVARRLAD
jgi:hypothetical protein